MYSVTFSGLQSSAQMQEDHVTALMEEEHRRQQELLQVSKLQSVACVVQFSDLGLQHHGHKFDSQRMHEMITCTLNTERVALDNSIC